MDVICCKENNLQDAKQVELMIVIGNKNKKETCKLYQFALECCNNAMIVEKLEDIYTNYINRFKKVGILKETSASKELVDEVVQTIKNIKTVNWIYENKR